MRDAWPDRGPKAVDAAGIDDVALLGVLQHRQKRAGAVIDAAPADVERALPFVAAVGNHAAAAADTGVVEQQVDLVGLVTVGNLVAKPLDLRPVGVATAKSRSNAAARFSATSRRNRLVNWGRLPCRAGSQLSYRMIDLVFINMDCAGAPGAGVPPVSLRAEARPADLRRPVPHPKPGAHSHTVAAEKP